MLSNFECPYCASCESTLISNFHSTVLNAKTSVYQCGQCLNLFDFPRDVKISELQKRLSDLQQDADERIAVAEAANAIKILDNQELATAIARVQRESLIAQLNLIRQQIITINPANKESMEELRRQDANIQVKLIEVQKQEVQRILSDLQQNVDVEEEISIAVSSEISTDAEDESQVLVVLYGYDFLNNCVPIDSFWTDPNNFILPHFEPTTLIHVADINPLVFSPVPHLLRLLFGVFQIIFGIWLLCLAFGF